MCRTNSGGKQSKTTPMLSHVAIKMITFNINLPLFVLFRDYFRLFPQSKVTFDRLVLCLSGGDAHKLPKLIFFPLLNRQEKKRGHRNISPPKEIQCRTRLSGMNPAFEKLSSGNPQHPKCIQQCLFFFLCVLCVHFSIELENDFAKYVVCQGTSPPSAKVQNRVGSVLFVFRAQILSIRFNLFGAADGLGCGESGQIRYSQLICRV